MALFTKSNAAKFGRKGAKAARRVGKAARSYLGGQDRKADAFSDARQFRREGYLDVVVRKAKDGWNIHGRVPRGGR